MGSIRWDTRRLDYSYMDLLGQDLSDPPRSYSLAGEQLQGGAFGVFPNFLKGERLGLKTSLLPTVIWVIPIN